jgi:hypothetical protein
VARARREPAHAAAFGELERAPQGLAGRGAAIGSVQRGAEFDERARMFELGRRVGEQLDRVLEQGDRVLASGGARDGAQAGRARGGEPEAVGELEMLCRKSPGGGSVVEGDERLGGVDAPGGEAGVADVELVPAGGGRVQVGVRVGVPVLGEPQAGAALKQERGAWRSGWGSPSWPAAARAALASSSSPSSVSASTSGNTDQITAGGGLLWSSLKSNERRASVSASRIRPACTCAIARRKLPWASAISHPRGRAMSTRALQRCRAASSSPPAIRTQVAMVPSSESASPSRAPAPRAPASRARAWPAERASHTACHAALIRHSSSGGGEESRRRRRSRASGTVEACSHASPTSSASSRASSSGRMPAAACSRPRRQSRMASSKWPARPGARA